MPRKTLFITNIVHNFFFHFDSCKLQATNLKYEKADIIFFFKFKRKNWVG